MSFSRQRHASVAMCLAIWCSNGGAFALADTHRDPLTLAEAQRLADARSERVAAARFAQLAAQELTDAADELPDPVLRMGVDNAPITGTNPLNLNRDFMTMTRVGVMQEITRSDKRRLRGTRADLEVATAQAERDVTLAAVQRETALAWFRCYYAERIQALWNSQSIEAQASAVAVESAYVQGRGNSPEVLMARAATVQVQDQLADATSRSRKARIELARWIGDEESQRPLGERPAIDVLPLHARHDPAQLEAQLSDHPDIVVFDRRAELAQTEAQLARAERKSDWTVELSYGRRGDAYDDMISLGVSIPLQLSRGHRQDREIASRLAAASAAKAQRDDMYREHLAEVRMMLDTWNTARQRFDLYESQLLPLAQDRIVAAEAGYRSGKQELAEVIAARRNQIETATQAARIESEIARLWAELSFLTVQTSQSAASGEQP